MYIAPGDYNPNSIRGVSLIAHELTHAQQFQDMGINDFVAWYVFGYLFNYYWDRDSYQAYRDIALEQEAWDVEDYIRRNLEKKFGTKDPYPKQTKPCG